ncbi:MAG: anti-FecI sigma factor, FecR [Gammaproteobacteria bacterium]|nr:anti-FecI sigma factor, FecR [Gammaproteobacteria bacterium]
MDDRERRARVSEQAAEWLLSSKESAMSHAERIEFVDWLRESPLHVEEMLRAAQLHGALGTFADWANVTPGDLQANPVAAFPPTGVHALGGESRRPRSFTLSLAAAAACAVLGGLLWLVPRLGDQVFDTDVAERREVTLADGSHLQIAPQTRVRVRLGATERRVVLEHGRAVFRVAKDPSRPFLVEARRTTVRAVGTAFGVEIDHNAVTVTVSHGRIAVTEALASEIPFIDSGSQSIPAMTLIAGEQVAVHSGHPSAVRNVDVGRELAWADDRLVLRNDSVADAARLFNNANRLQLHITDPALAARKVSGVFDASDPLSFVALLQSEQPEVAVESNGDDYVVRLAAKPPVPAADSPAPL